MSIIIDVQRCKVFQEFTAEEQKQYFSLTWRKVLHNIDTLYYSVYLAETDSDNITAMVEHLQSLREQVQKDRTKEIVYQDFLVTPYSFSIYSNCLRVENMFDVFIANYLPNSDTPRIVIQLRSIGLWVDGTETMLLKSIEHLKQLLDCFNVRILKVAENRIDYAFHTNSIQNPYKFFGDKALLKSLRTSLRKYHKVGDIGREITIDYFSLGMRTSNNLFFRAYNKTKEVIEKNYKSFFIEYWYQNKLINEFDKICLEYAYQKGTYNGLIEGRCMWYLQHGKDEKFKAELKQLISTCLQNSDNYEYLEKFIDGVIPNVTVVMNIEYQTKRKFYSTFEYDIIQWKSKFPKGVSKDIQSVMHRLFSIVQNRKSIIEYLTTVSVTFITGEHYSAWWKRIISCKLKNDLNGHFIREYSKKLDKERVKRSMVSSVATYSIYNGHYDSDITADFADMVGTLNDNDLYGTVALVDTETGSLLNLSHENYNTMKNKKLRRLKPLIEGR